MTLLSRLLLVGPVTGRQSPQFLFSILSSSALDQQHNCSFTVFKCKYQHLSPLLKAYFSPDLQHRYVPLRTETDRLLNNLPFWLIIWQRLCFGELSLSPLSRYLSFTDGLWLGSPEPCPGVNATLSESKAMNFNALQCANHHQCSQAQVEDYDAEDDAEGEGRAVFLRWC